MSWLATVDPMDRLDRPTHHTSRKYGRTPFLGLVKWKPNTGKSLSDHMQVCIDSSNLDEVYTNASIAQDCQFPNDAKKNSFGPKQLHS